MIATIPTLQAFAPVLRRVRKIDAKTDAWVRPDALDTCLYCWRVWMGRRDTDLGAKSQRTLQGDGDGFGNSETMAARRDNEIAEATDAMIGDLTSAHRWAIFRKCSIATAWRFPQLDYMTTAQEAVESLEKKLRGNVATRMLFG